MRAGRLRHRLTINELIETQDDYNEPVEKWIFWARRWGDVEDLRGAECHLAQQVPGGKVTTRVRIRYTTGIIPLRFQVVHGTRTLLVVAVTDAKGRRRELELMCREIISGQS